MSYPPPGSGYPAGYPQPAGYPPPPNPRALVKSNELRPGRYWFAIVIVATLLACAAAVAIAIVVIVKAQPDIPDTFSGSDTTEVEFKADEQRTIYVNQQTYDPDSATEEKPTCTVTAADGDGRADLDEYSSTVTTTSGGSSWMALYDVDVSRSGTYLVSCTAANPGDDNADDSYGVGTTFKIGQFVGAMIGIFVAPLLFLLIGGIFVIVIAVRRSTYRSKLVRQRHWEYYQNPPSTP